MSGAADWLKIADNQRTWARLSDSLALADRFELVFAVVVDAQARAYLQELLEARAHELGWRVVSVDARDEDVLGRLTSLGSEQALVVLDTVAASRRASAELERCLLELNPRRDWLAQTLPGPVVASMRPDGLRRLADLAPDLFSVHTASFRFFGGADLGLEERPEWLLADHEFVGLLGIDPSFGYADRSRVPKIVREPPQPPERLIGREELLAQLEPRLMPGGEQTIRIVGQPGVGRTALLAQIVTHTRPRWDRVTWLDCRHVWPWQESDAIVDATLEQLAPNEAPPFDPRDSRERFSELTTLHSVLIVADDTYPTTLAKPGPRSCIVTIGHLSHGQPSTIVAQLSDTELQELGKAVGLPPTTNLPMFYARLPGSLHVFGRWLSNLAGESPEHVTLLRPRLQPAGFRGAVAEGIADLCEAIVETCSPKHSRAFEKLLDLSGWLLGFPRDSNDEEILSDLQRLGVLRIVDDQYQFSETGIGRWQYVAKPPFPPDRRLAAEAVADQLYANLGSALRMCEHTPFPWMDTIALTLDNLERCAAALAPAIRSAMWRSAINFLPLNTAEKQACFKSAIITALQCGQAEQARGIREQLCSHGKKSALLDMLAMLRPVEWDPDLAYGRELAATYAMNEAEPEIAAAIYRGFNASMSHHDDPLPEAPPARAALALRCDPCTPESLHNLLAPLDQSRELDRLAAHFIWSRLAWLHILAHDWPAFDRAFAEVERSARTWGISYALVRLRLLELTALEVRGELDRAADKLPSTLAAVDRTYGTRSRTALALLRRAVGIFTELDRGEDAKQASSQIRERRRATPA